MSFTYLSAKHICDLVSNQGSPVTDVYVSNGNTAYIRWNLAFLTAASTKILLWWNGHKWPDTHT